MTPTPTVIHGDCLTALRAMPDASIHAVVTDPPYGLSNTDPAHVVETLARWASGERDYVPTGRGFMGKSWDAFVPPPAVWDECLRVLKPGGHLLAFAGSRTFDLMTLSIRFAGFDIRDSIAWLYGSGFPKGGDLGNRLGPEWKGWSSQLKPSQEPIIVARKSFGEPLASNVLKHGTGALNIDETRVGDDTSRGDRYGGKSPMPNGYGGDVTGTEKPREGAWEVKPGRWPTNVVLDGHAADALDEQSGTLKSGALSPANNVKASANDAMSGGNQADRVKGTWLGDSGGASRYFPTFRYQAKAPTRERPSYEREDGTRVAHPTVKPTSAHQCAPVH